jgi:hypothetical protein
MNPPGWNLSQTTGGTPDVLHEASNSAGAFILSRSFAEPPQIFTGIEREFDADDELQDYVHGRLNREASKLYGSVQENAKA